MITEKQARAAADCPNSELKRFVLVERARQELARREQPDDGPIDAEWCEGNGAYFHRDIKQWEWGAGGVTVRRHPEASRFYVGHQLVDHVPTRSQLLALLKALKGE